MEWRREEKKGSGMIPTMQNSLEQQNRSVTTQKWAAYACLIASMSLVGSYVALTKPLVLAIPVLLLAWLRFGIAAVAMLTWLKKPHGEPSMDLKTKKLLFLESFLGNFLFSIFMLFGVSMTSTVSAGIILSAIPAVTAVMSWYFLKETISKRVIAGIGCAITGIALLSTSKLGLPVDAVVTNPLSAKPHESLQHILGNILVFGAVLCEAAYIVIGKRLTTEVSPKRIAAIINLVGLILMTPFGIYYALAFQFATVAATSWFLLLFYALAASVGTVWLWMTGIKTIPAAKAGVFSVMLPITAACIGVFLFNEDFSMVQGIAFTFALVGLLLATTPQSPK